MATYYMHTEGTISVQADDQPDADAILRTLPRAIAVPVPLYDADGQTIGTATITVYPGRPLGTATMSIRDRYEQIREQL